MEEFVRNLIHISDLSVLTKKMVRKKYKEHLGIKDLDPEIKDKLRQTLNSSIEEIAKSQDVSAVPESLRSSTPTEELKTETDGNKENNSAETTDDNIIKQKSFVRVSNDNTNSQICVQDSDKMDHEKMDQTIQDNVIMSPPKKRVPRKVVDKTLPPKKAQTRNMKFDDVLAAVQDSDATSGLEEASDASSDFDMVQKLSGASLPESRESSAYEAESETDLDQTITKSKLYTHKKSHVDLLHDLDNNFNNNYLGEVTPVKRGVVSDRDCEDSPVIVKKSMKRKSLLSDSGSESENGLMIDLPMNDLTPTNKKSDAKTYSTIPSQNLESKDNSNIFPSADFASDIFSISDSDNEPLSKLSKNAKNRKKLTGQGTILDACNNQNDNSVLPPDGAPAKKILLKLKRVQTNSSDDNDYNYEISESNEEDRKFNGRKGRKVKQKSSNILDSDSVTSSQGTETSESVHSGPCVKKQRKFITPAIVKDSEDFDSDAELHPITVTRKVKKRKAPAKKNATRTPATPEDKELKFLRQICNKLGLVLRNTKELAGCVSSADKVFRIRELLENAGMIGEPTMKKVEQLKLQKEVKELKQNSKFSDTESAGRPKRLAQTKLAQAEKSPYVLDKSIFDGLEGIVDSDGSD